MKQVVGHKPLSAAQCAILVLALALVLVLLNYLVLDVLAALVGYSAACVGFWALGGLIALWVLRVYVVKFSYELGQDVLQLNRSYGKRKRHIEDVYLSQLVFVGEPAAAKKKYPDARRVRAIHARGTDPVLAVAYKSAQGVRVALIQANEELRARLIERLRGK